MNYHSWEVIDWVEVVSDHDEDFIVLMVIFVDFIEQLGIMSSTMEEIKEKVFAEEEELNLHEELEEWGEVMESYSDTSWRQCVHDYGIGDSMVENVASNDRFHYLLTVFLLPRPFKVRVDLKLFIDLSSEITRCIAAYNEYLGDYVNS